MLSGDAQSFYARSESIQAGTKRHVKFRRLFDPESLVSFPFFKNGEFNYVAVFRRHRISINIL